MIGLEDLGRMASNYQRFYPEFTHQQLLLPLMRMYHYLKSTIDVLDVPAPADEFKGPFEGKRFKFG